jgi:hypothetical protein
MMRIALLLIVVFLGATMAPAGSVADSAAAVQKEVEEALARLAALDPSLGLAYGAVDVVPQGKAFNVAVADVSIRLAANDPGYLDFGIVTFRLTPQEGYLYRVEQIAMPAQVPHRGADGLVDGTWEVDNRALAGLWSRRQGGFLRRDAVVDVGLAITGLDATMGAIAAAPPQAGSSVRWMQLLLFRGLARRETAANGAAVDRYEVKVTPKGPVVINGRSLDFLSPAALTMP